jgi:hypothetical protein
VIDATVSALEAQSALLGLGVPRPSLGLDADPDTSHPYQPIPGAAVAHIGQRHLGAPVDAGV